VGARAASGGGRARKETADKRERGNARSGDGNEEGGTASKAESASLTKRHDARVSSRSHLPSRSPPAPSAAGPVARTYQTFHGGHVGAVRVAPGLDRLVRAGRRVGFHRRARDLEAMLNKRRRRGRHRRGGRHGKGGAPAATRTGARGASARRCDRTRGRTRHPAAGARRSRGRAREGAAPRARDERAQRRPSAHAGVGGGSGRPHQSGDAGSGPQADHLRRAWRACRARVNGASTAGGAGGQVVGRRTRAGSR